MSSIISPAILRTVLSAVSSCRTERGCPACQAANPARSNSITTPPRPHRKSSLPLLDCELDASMRGVLLGVGCGCDWAGRGGERPAQCRAATAPHRRTYTPAILSPHLATPQGLLGSAKLMQMPAGMPSCWSYPLLSVLCVTRLDLIRAMITPHKPHSSRSGVASSVQHHH